MTEREERGQREEKRQREEKKIARRIIKHWGRLPREEVVLGEFSRLS